jgi:hypothetical protein
MSSLLSEPPIVAALIALIGVLVSVILTWSNARRQVHAALESLERTIAARYEEKLVERRMDDYQPLWGLLARLSKSALDARFNAGELKPYIDEVRAALEGWYENHGLLLSKDAYGRFHRLRALLDAHSKRAKFDNPADLAKIRKYRWNLYQALRADIHVEPIQPRPQQRQSSGKAS